jgi:predicted alpha/beta-fold hydrolase
MVKYPDSEKHPERLYLSRNVKGWSYRGLAMRVRSQCHSKIAVRGMFSTYIILEQVWCADKHSKRYFLKRTTWCLKRFG